ncbi:unnamed protein product [Polarella glacialis]|uniref:Reverse transcriptase domain-containing protein n=1 Tax=Polarella glacialis TaxID=89957 RepID=A0A813DGT7_POLGL|nr:unnamed protein product [Polarella glacialis]
MLPKPGDATQPSNWRPIAILKITYKLFSRLLYQRLRDRLETHQTYDQVGFRPDCSVDDAFIVFDAVCGRALEWNLDLWFASLDLRKAFDRIRYDALFDALRGQGVDDHHLALVAALYSHQTGSILGSNDVFDIERGVKQGDIASPLFFNAGLELALGRWKARLSDHGVALDTGERLTNIRYADDLMLYATSLDQLCQMMTLLSEELSRVGLDLNMTKTKILTTCKLEEVLYVDLAGGMVEVLFEEASHKYLGRKLGGNLKKRSATEFANRRCCAWAKFNLP